MSLDPTALDSLKIDRGAPPPRRPAAGLKWLVLVLLFGGAAAATGVWLFGGRVPSVEVATAEAAGGEGSSGALSSARAAAVLNASGYVVARREATVSAKTTGKVAEVLVEEGMEVEAGQLLARLDDETLRPQLALAEQQVQATRTELQEVMVRHAESERNLRRTEQLHANQAVSDLDLDRAQSEFAALTARVAALRSAIGVAEATVDVRRQDLADLEIRAPFAGVVVSKDAQPGEMVSPVSAGGGFTRTGIATLVDMASREIEVDVNEAYINRVYAGQQTEAVLDAYPEWVIASHVVNIVPTADRQKATVRVRIGFDELDPRILANMGIKVTFLDSRGGGNGTDVVTGTSRPAVRVPAGAVQRDGGTSFVWRLRNDRVERIAVSVGAERNGMVEIVAGIQAGDAVVARPVEGLADGVTVAVEP